MEQWKEEMAAYQAVKGSAIVDIPDEDDASEQQEKGRTGSPSPADTRHHIEESGHHGVPSLVYPRPRSESGPYLPNGTRPVTPLASVTTSVWPAS